MEQSQQTARAMIPQGVATFLPEAAYLKRVIEREILNVFFKWGFQEIITPIFEYLDVVSLGMEQEVIEKGYKIVDRSNGRVMILRPDVTTQVARMVAMLFSDRPKPLRLCYRENVFRYEGEHEGREREIFQVGGELIGLAGPEADAEMIAIVVESLRRLGLSDFRIILGQVELSRSLLQKMRLPLEFERQLQEALMKKETGLVRSLLRRSDLPRTVQNRFLTLMGLMGGPEVLKEAADLVTDRAARKALKNLEDVYGLLQAHGVEGRVLVDLGEIRGFEYYTGVVYEVFANGVGYEIGRGGRYDNLIAKFGSPSPSTGFAFDLERLELALNKEGRRTDFSAADLLLVGSRKAVRRVVTVARDLRRQGYRVMQRIARVEGIKELRSYATSVNIPVVLIVGGAKSSVVTAVEVATGRQRQESLRRLCTQAAHPLWTKGA